MRDFDRFTLQRLSRRHLLQAASAIAGIGLVSGLPGCRISSQPLIEGDPFGLGVASGDPHPDGVVLWTRLQPDPLGETGAGLPNEMISVRWQVARDEGMTDVVREGAEPAVPELAHTVHVEVEGLEPARVYYYQFRVGDALSPVGRTKTAPAADASPSELRFAFASCSDWQNGFFTAYGAMAQEDLDLVIHLGDYIYEYGPQEDAVRQHNSPEIMTLDDYRRRYALYKSDPNLQAAHAAFPWSVTWDDHETDNNYADLVSEEEGVGPEAFEARRAAAYQAYYEHMPLRRSSLPRGAQLQLYRRLTFGRLAEFSILDTRQYRSDQPCGDGLEPRCAAALDPEMTLTGPEQEQWLLNGLGASAARWNFIGQQTMMAQYDWQAGEGQAFNMDQWDGYLAARQRILGYLGGAEVSNPVVLTGDIHSSWVHDLTLDFDDPNARTVATELITTSISANFPAEFIEPVEAALSDNPHANYFNGRERGYVRVTVTPETLTSEVRTVSSITDREAEVSTAARFVVENAQPGAQQG